MARLDELAEGMAKMLKITDAPEPLPVDMVGEGPVETTLFVRAIIDASRRHEAPIDRVCVDPHLGSGLLKESGNSYEGVALETDDTLEGRILIWRYPQG